MGGGRGIGTTCGTATTWGCRSCTGGAAAGGGDLRSTCCTSSGALATTWGMTTGGATGMAGGGATGATGMAGGATGGAVGRSGGATGGARKTGGATGGGAIGRTGGATAGATCKAGGACTASAAARMLSPITCASDMLGDRQERLDRQGIITCFGTVGVEGTDPGMTGVNLAIRTRTWPWLAVRYGAATRHAPI